MNVFIARAVCLIIGYAFGSFQTAFILGKLNGIDIREHGSGNSGTTNMMRTMGTKAGLITLLGDILKVVFAIIITYFIFRESYSDMLPLLKVYTSAGAILGHNFPFYMGFKGGKGIAVTAGMILSFDPIVVAIEAFIFFLVFFTTHYVSLGSLLIYVGFLIEIIVMGATGYLYEHYAMNPIYNVEISILVFLLGAMAFYKHRENIKRLLSGNERKTYLKHKS